MPITPQITSEDGCKKDEKLGLLTDRLSYIADTKREALAYTPPAADLIVPVVLRTISRRPEGKFNLFLDCEGHEDPNNADGHEYTVEGTTSDEPVETNWNIQEIIDKYAPGRKPDPQTNKIKFPLYLTVDGGQKIVNPMYGTEAYLEPGLVWTHTFVSTRLLTSWVRELGTISTPDSGPEGQTPPELEGNRFWFNLRMSASFRGNIWKISRSWMMTGRRGYVPELYKRQS